DPRVHVGLGGARRVERVDVRWVDGCRERFGPFAADGQVLLRRGSGEQP
ncbi:MAG: ASPIC/UnbV domain-containing protein, partial [Chloroflexi bacterium]|nr:ASPIC/UnbV domain-containing protein [Chloroflexota bacterium]